MLSSVEQSITEIALQPKTADDSLYRALAESLTAGGVGFAILYYEGDDEVSLRTVYGSDGTSFLGVSSSPNEYGHADTKFGLIEEWKAQFDRGEAHYFETLDIFAKDPDVPAVGILRSAFANSPVFAVKLMLTKGDDALLIISSSEITKEDSHEVMGLADKLSLAHEIIRLKFDLETAEAKHDWMFQTSETGLVLLSSEGTILELNSKAADYVGIPREELIGERIRGIFAEIEDWFDQVIRIISDTFHPTRQFVYTQRRGQVSHLRLELLPLSHDPEGSQLLRITDLSIPHSSILAINL